MVLPLRYLDVDQRREWVWVAQGPVRNGGEEAKRD